MSAMETAVRDVVAGCLAVFAVTWLVGALYFGARKSGGLRRWLAGVRGSLPARLGLIAGVGVVLALSGGGRGPFWRHLEYWQPLLAVVGVVVVVASTALLVWARWVLGTMWASVPLVQERHELRTNGPYGYVRHPIYTGFLGVVLGGMLADGFGVWVLIAAVSVPWLLHRVRVEDRLMAAEFGEQYAAYRRRVPALLPFTSRRR
ncbi:protein-S-isoprenylcysteine O-methyltransferase Ste14 [Streptacidiphilus sp. MAP12-20]|uniref:methyltransferase family protein n=1 Tax=Streptacidiphilus sp. MAP12-20 TaxID=3156299 RepID=UPI003513F2AE